MKVCLLESACTPVRGGSPAVNHVILLRRRLTELLFDQMSARLRAHMSVAPGSVDIGEPPTALVINVQGWGWVLALGRRRAAHTLSCCASHSELMCVQFAL